MAEDRSEVVVPVIAEELHADAVPVETGGVRITKRIETHEEVLAQELRKSHVEVKRVKTDRVVDGPQPVRRSGQTLIVPVVSEVLRIEKQWVVTEEIHITEIEQREHVEQTVEVNREIPRIERIDSEGNAVSPVETSPERVSAETSDAETSDSETSGEEARPAAPASMLSRNDSRLPAAKKTVLSESRSLLRKKPKEKGRG